MFGPRRGGGEGGLESEKRVPVPEARRDVIEFILRASVRGAARAQAGTRRDAANRSTTRGTCARAEPFFFYGAIDFV